MKQADRQDIAREGFMIAMPDAPNRAGLTHLRQWREWRGWSQQELGALADVNYVTISRLETGVSRANWETIRKLAHALGITREQLLHEEPK
jgi:DNA-binding XRE family transcriptional regulator